MQSTIVSTETHSSDAAQSGEKMNLLRINFDELYRRHLGRHSQFGLNVLHLIAVYGIYFSIYSLVAIAVRTAVPQLSAVQQSGVMGLLSLPYLALLFCNVPLSMFVATGLSIAILIAGAVCDTANPFWAHGLLIILWHRFQLWSHKRYPLQRDMSEFSSKYKKGFLLFVLLAVYELPILLKYLLAGRRDWVQ